MSNTAFTAPIAAKNVRVGDALVRYEVRPNGEVIGSHRCPVVEVYTDELDCPVLVIDTPSGPVELLDLFDDTLVMTARAAS